MKFFILLSLSFAAWPRVETTIPNFFQVDREGKIFRGKEPRGRVQEIKDLGIDHVIIFKNEMKDEVKKEISNLGHLGIKTFHIPFKWKDYSSYETPCLQTVEALNLLHAIKMLGGTSYLHCTAGEDRTGFLAGLYRMLEEGETSKSVFRSEMCDRGYSNGNPRKPYVVTSAIEKGLTPLFEALALKIETQKWKIGKIDPATCKDLKVNPSSLTCR